METSRNAKWTLVGIGLFAGLFGGFIGARLFPAAPPTVDCERVDATEIVARSVQVVDENGDVSCRIVGGDMAIAGRVRVGTGLRVQSKDNKVLCDISGGHLAVPGCVRGNIVLGSRLFASTNPTTATLDRQEILAEMSALPDRGGMMIVRDPKGVFVPGKGNVSQGQAIMIGYNNSVKPLVAVNDIDKDRQYRFWASPTSNQPADVASWWNSPDGTSASESEENGPVVYPVGPSQPPAGLMGNSSAAPIPAPSGIEESTLSMPGVPYAAPYQNEEMHGQTMPSPHLMPSTGTQPEPPAPAELPKSTMSIEVQAPQTIPNPYAPRQPAEVQPTAHSTDPSMGRNTIKFVP